MEILKIQLHTRLPRIKIDSTDTRADLGFKSPQAIREEGVALGKQAVLDGIGRRAEEGNRFQRIEDDSNPIAEIASEVMQETVGYNVALVPKTPPQISFEEGKVEISTEQKRAGSNLRLNLLV
jgi:hypothetical protein